MAYWCQCRKQLSEIPGLYVLAEAFLTPGSGGKGSSSGERTIGVNSTALGFREAAEILPVLEDWERTVRVKFFRQEHLDGQDREGEVEMNADGTIKAIVRPRLNERERPIVRRGSIQERIQGGCAFLLAQIDWIAQQDFAADFLNDIGAMYADGNVATRQIEPPVRRIACPADLGDGLCRALLALPEDSDKETKIRCPRCRTEWSIQWLIDVALEINDAEYWCDSKSIANHLRVDNRQVRRLARKWKLKQRGQLYDLTEFNKHFVAEKKSNTPKGA
jgi:hypothetical protein